MIRLLLLLLLLGTGCEKLAESPSVTVFAAASLSEILTELTDSFTQQTGIKVNLHVAASSMLAHQIEAGADFDLYISANVLWMDRLAASGQIDTASRITIVRNQLAVICPRGSGNKLTEQFKGRLAMGDPAHVPAGMYAQQALTHLGLWDALQDQVLPAIDAPAALRYVESGNADLGIVYVTDAQSSTLIDMVKMLPTESHAPIVYPAAASKNAGENTSALLAFLQTDDAQRVFTKAGFE